MAKSRKPKRPEKKKKKTAALPKPAPPPVRLDIGCGKSKQPGFLGVDIEPFDGVDKVMDVRRRPWPWSDESVDEIHCSHFIEHLTGPERVDFFNEVWRILKFGGKITVITPDWSHACAYGDPTHQFPPPSAWYPLYLNKQWRDANAPHVKYTTDFDYTFAGAWDQWLSVRPQDTKEFAMQHYTNSMRDIIVTFLKVKREEPKGA